MAITTFVLFYFLNDESMYQQGAAPQKNKAKMEPLLSFHLLTICTRLEGLQYWLNCLISIWLST